MIDWIVGILAFVIVLSVIIIIHEGGHFLFAKKAGILCYEFALGMGPVIYQKRKGETQYSIRAIPLGGYVSMAGEEVEADLLKGVETVKLVLTDNVVTKIITNVKSEKYKDLEEYKLISYDLIGTKDAKLDELFIEVELTNEEDPRLSENIKYVVARDAILSLNDKQELQIAPHDRTFVNKTIWQRFITVFAGPMMNFVLAWFIFVLMGLIGGYADTSSTNLDAIAEGTPAYLAGLKEGDEIVKIGTYTGSLNEWADVSAAMAYYASGSATNFDGSIEITYKRDGVEYTTTAYPQTVIYSMELVFKTYDKDNHELANLPIVGTYNDKETNTKTIAYKSGLRDGDIIKSIKVLETNEVINVETRNDVLKFFSSYSRPNVKGADIEVTVLRENEELKYEVETYSQELLASQGVTTTKVKLEISPEYKFNFLKLLYQPFVQTGDAAMLVFDTLKLLVTDKTVNLNDLSGPIGILSIIKSAAAQGLLTLLNWTAIISVNVGLMNLLPIPALDGGRLIFIIYEAITKKKPSPKFENMVHNIGFILLMALFVYVAFNDVIRLIFK